MRRLLTPFAVGLVAALALPLTAGTAHAAKVTIADPAGDVRTATPSADGTTFTEADAPGLTPDVTSLTIKHARRAVTVQLTTTGLTAPTADQGLIAGLRFEGSNKQRRVLTVLAVAERPGGRVNALLREGNGKRVCGKAVRSRIDYATGTVTATVPRRCLGAPKRVRVAGVTLSTTSADTSPVVYDDALQTGGSFDSAGTVFSPFVKRG